MYGAQRLALLSMYGCWDSWFRLGMGLSLCAEPRAGHSGSGVTTRTRLFLVDVVSPTELVGDRVAAAYAFIIKAQVQER